MDDPLLKMTATEAANLLQNIIDSSQERECCDVEIDAFHEEALNRGIAAIKSYKNLENQYVTMCAYYEAEIEKLRKQLKQQRDPNNLEQTLRNEIAAAVADKMDYMHCCENERETYLRIIRDDCEPFDSHCTRDCTNTNCESHPDYKKRS